jgi:hypothetical protein
MLPTSAPELRAWLDASTNAKAAGALTHDGQ